METLQFTDESGLIINFNPAALLEIKVRKSMLNNGWTAVTPDIFRSWGGDRRIDNQPYEGPVYKLWTNTVEVMNTVTA